MVLTFYPLTLPHLKNTFQEYIYIGLAQQPERYAGLASLAEFGILGHSGSFWVILGHSGVILGSFWGHSGVVLGSFWGHSLLEIA